MTSIKRVEKDEEKGITEDFDAGIYKPLLEEFIRFRKRTNTISSLSEISSLSKEWEQLAETQTPQAFSPPL